MAGACLNWQEPEAGACLNWVGVRVGVARALLPTIENRSRRCLEQPLMTTHAHTAMCQWYVPL